MEKGGELANKKEVMELVLLHEYGVRPTGGDILHQNDPAKRPHQTTGHSLRTMIHGKGLTFKFWQYSFHHYIMLHNIMHLG
jgi:hypothetical protein